MNSSSLPFPGSGTAVNRVVGRYAVCAAGGLTLTAHDYELEIRTDFADGTAHGDLWDVPVPLKYSWTARVRGYYHAADATYLTAYGNQITGSPPPDLTAISFTAYRDAAAAHPIFTGTGFVVRGQWAAPDGMVEQELELRGTGIPTVIA